MKYQRQTATTTHRDDERHKTFNVRWAAAMAAHEQKKDALDAAVTAYVANMSDGERLITFIAALVALHEQHARCQEMLSTWKLACPACAEKLKAAGVPAVKDLPDPAEFLRDVGGA
ncbi:MAG TPA: hypothetical protein VH393_05510 [Ktedonobacterales bacterium]|jgi:hypothetical protein